jgi:membrane protein CcdC involved in cytochrome C biogenesis
MTQQQWDLIGYAVWAVIIWMTLKQFLQTRREVTGSGLKLLLGDWLLFAPLPWIFICMGHRATSQQVLWTVVTGLALAVPYILTSRFFVKPNGRIQFRSNPLFYAFLFGFPYVRYLIRDKVFHQYPILLPNHRPDIELMLAEYVAVLVIFTFVWRLSLYIKYRLTLKKAGASPDSNSASARTASA